MKVWVDADACPLMIKEIILRAVIKRSIPTVFVANKYLKLPASNFISAVQVKAGADIADQYIAEHAKAGDLVITQDIPLASILVRQGIPTISVHGTLFTEANIGERLSMRNFSQEIRDYGGKTQGPKPFSDKDKQQFANSFDRELTKLIKNHV